MHEATVNKIRKAVNKVVMMGHRKASNTAGEFERLKTITERRGADEIERPLTLICEKELYEGNPLTHGMDTPYKVRKGLCIL